LIRFPTDARLARGGTPIGFVLRLLLTAYFLNAGLLLAVAPWTVWWERNLFASLLPDLSAWMAPLAVRAGVSAIGVMTVGTGLAELWSLRRVRTDRTSPSPAAAPPDS
jgi:hypothetical protein